MHDAGEPVYDGTAPGAEERVMGPGCHVQSYRMIGPKPERIDWKEPDESGLLIRRDDLVQLMTGMLRWEVEDGKSELQRDDQGGQAL